MQNQYIFVTWGSGKRWKNIQYAAIFDMQFKKQHDDQFLSTEQMFLLQIVEG